MEDDVVIVAATRTAIGRARKGSLVDARPDDLVAFAIRSALEKLPELDPGEVVGARVDERALAGAADRGAGGCGNDGFGHPNPSYVNALSPVSARPMISFWIWLVPS